jgi:hypothetical protein
MEKPFLFDFSQTGDEENGLLSVAEHSQSLPFEPKRVYWVYKTPENVSRGNAANRKCVYALVCPKGEALVEIIDLKGQKSNFKLTDPNQGLYIPPMHWRNVSLDSEAILLCLASEKFDLEDYIRDFEEFLAT